MAGKAAKAAKANTGRSLADFRSAHDKNVIVPRKIQAALDDMLKEGPENWSYEAEFIRRAGISQTDMGLFRDNFSAHIVETRDKTAKRVWFASAQVATALRGDGS